MPGSYRKSKRSQLGGSDDQDRLWQHIINKTNKSLQKESEWGLLSNGSLSTLSTLSSVGSLSDKLQSNPLTDDDIESLKSKLTIDEERLDDEAVKSVVVEALRTKVEAEGDEVDIIKELVGNIHFGKFNINSDFDDYSGVLSTQPSLNNYKFGNNSINSLNAQKPKWPPLFPKGIAFGDFPPLSPPSTNVDWSKGVAFGAFQPGARLSQLITGTSSTASSNATSRRTTTNSISSSNSNSSKLLDYLVDENKLDESFVNLTNYQLTNDMRIGDFYDPTAGSAFPYKILKDKKDYDGAKTEIKKLLNDLRYEHEGVVDSILDSDKVHKSLIFQRYITHLNKITILLSRVYVCIMVSEINSTSPLTSSASTVSELEQRVDTLKKVLSDIVPFLLQLEGEKNQI
jgi:hypothetical protein